MLALGTYTIPLPLVPSGSFLEKRSNWVMLNPSSLFRPAVWSDNLIVLHIKGGEKMGEYLLF